MPGCLDHVSVVENCRYDQKQRECPAGHRERRGNTDGRYGKRRGRTAVAKAALSRVVGSYHVEEEKP